MKIAIEYVYPPIPDRRFDYSAVDSDTYDYDGPIGYGPTPQDATADLLEKIQFRKDLEDETN